MNEYLSFTKATWLCVVADICFIQISCYLESIVELVHPFLLPVVAFHPPGSPVLSTSRGTIDPE